MPIAASCVEISSTVQTNKNKKSKLNITPNATLWRDKNHEVQRDRAMLRVFKYFAKLLKIIQGRSK